MRKSVRKRVYASLTAFIFLLSISLVFFVPPTQAKVQRPVYEIPMPIIVLEKPEREPVEEIVEPEPAPVPEEPEKILDISEEDINLLAIVTMAEAEGEPELGQRLVIDTVLNRMDSPYFPDTIYDVIWQKNQFTSMWNGRADRCYVKEDIVQLIQEELVCRTDSDVVFFRTGHYSSYGVPLFQVGNHYFSSY